MYTHINKMHPQINKKSHSIVYHYAKTYICFKILYLLFIHILINFKFIYQEHDFVYIQFYIKMISRL